jgi:hypothetical protein
VRPSPVPLMQLVEKFLQKGSWQSPRKSFSSSLFPIVRYVGACTRVIIGDSFVIG